MEGLTLMDLGTPILALALLDDDQKLVQVLQLSREAFTP
jgi:hypothetical protein